MTHSIDNRLNIEALTFDVFGTVVDWRGSIVRLGEVFALKHNLGNVNWESFALDWRAGYGPSMNLVRKGDIPWANIDALHRRILDDIVPAHGLDHLNESERNEMNKFWHQLDPWPDALHGLSTIKKRYIIATLSNGNVALLTNMAKRAALPWDCVLSSELFRHYKPDAEVYTGAASLLGLDPSKVLMVAAHKNDLRAAKSCGMKTAFVPRPYERPNMSADDLTPEPWIDISAEDFEVLATKLEA